MADTAGATNRSAKYSDDLLVVPAPIDRAMKYWSTKAEPCCCWTKKLPHTVKIERSMFVIRKTAPDCDSVAFGTSVGRDCGKQAHHTLRDTFNSGASWILLIRDAIPKTATE